MPIGHLGAIVAAGDRVYLGGDFTGMAPPFGGFAVYRQGAGLPERQVVRFRDGGAVTAVANDGVGGWFVGGSFSSFGGSPCRGLVHVRARGSVDRRWCGVRVEEPSALVRQGRLLYVVAGRYVEGSGWTSGLVRFDIRTRRRIRLPVVLGQSSTIYPPNLWTVTATSTRVYLGGGFASVNGHDAKRFAALDAATGRFLFGATIEDGAVNRILVEDGRVFVFGDFGYVDGKRRRGAAALDADNGRLLAWRPKAPVRLVSSAVAEDGALFLGYGNRGRRMLVAVNGRTGATLWRRGGDSYPLASLDGRLIVHTGNLIVTLDARSGRHARWPIQIPGNPFLAPPRAAVPVAVSRRRIAIGGPFFSVGGERRRTGLAALDARTGQPLPWSPRLTAAKDEELSVDSLVAQGNALYLAGRFAAIDGQRRFGLAAVALDTGAVLRWNPPPLCSDYACPSVLAATSTAVYVSDATLDGKDRDLLALDQATGHVLASSPQPDGPVTAVAVGGDVYVGGCFAHLGTKARPNLAAVGQTSGAATTWTPAPDKCVDTIAFDNGILYVGGRFDHVGGFVRHHIAAFDTVTGRLLAWAPKTTATLRRVNSIVAAGSIVYVDGVPFDATTAQQLPWPDGPAGWLVNTVAPTPSLTWVDVGDWSGSPWGGLIAVSPP